MKLRLNASLETLLSPPNTIFLITVFKSPSSTPLTPAPLRRSAANHGADQDARSLADPQKPLLLARMYAKATSCMRLMPSMNGAGAGW